MLLAAILSTIMFLYYQLCIVNFELIIVSESKLYTAFYVGCPCSRRTPQITPATMLRQTVSGQAKPTRRVDGAGGLR